MYLLCQRQLTSTYLYQRKVNLGCEEWCSFPSLGVHAIKARVDSGAKISSISAFNIHKFRRNGQFWLSVEVHPL